MSKSIRWLIRGVHGRVRANFSWPGVITERSVVHITAGEVGVGGTGGEQFPPFQNFFYHVGDANVWVSNISPHHNVFRRDDPGGVRFIVNVDWDSPLDVAVTITVEDDIPLEIQGYRF
jgi:hypothetical protein